MTTWNPEEFGDNSYNDIYHHVMKHGVYWYHMAELLKIAADKILEDHLISLKNFGVLEIGKPVTKDDLSFKPDMELFPIYMLMMGYSFENGVKGIIVCEKLLQDVKFFDEPNFEALKVSRRGGRGNKKIASHGLIELLDVEVVSIEFTSEEMKVLREFDEYVSWSGRYPIPKKVKEPYIGHMIEFYNERPKIINTIFDKIMIELDRLCKSQDDDS